KTIIVVFSLLLSSLTMGQTISLSVKNTGLEKIFRQIEKQSPYRFVYSHETLQQTHPVTVEIHNASIDKVLPLCFNNQPVTYNINDRVVIVKALLPKSPVDTPVFHAITGRVMNEQGEALEGASVAIKGGVQGTATDAQGYFRLRHTTAAGKLVISNIGYRTKEFAFKGQFPLVISLEIAVNTLDETVVIGYGQTTRRLNTGNVSRVTAEEIGRQPVSNPLEALQGRVAGLVVTQSNGYPGASFKVQLRGQTSIGLTPGILPPNDPLFVINGVPFAPNNNHLNQISSALGNGGLSPFNSLNPADIESIEVLKDADATAIYGSRGANGVVLITTKKGIAGKTSVSANVYTGFQKALQSMDMLDTKQYVAMRKEALGNDGTIPDQFNAPDIVIWDTTRYTNWKDQFIGGTSNITNAQISLSGGNENTRYMFSSGFYHQTTVIPDNFAFNRGSLDVNFNHNSKDHRLRINIAVLYSASKNNIPTQDFTNNIRLAPNAPSLYDTAGNLRWEEQGVPFFNPLSYLKRSYSANIDNLLNNFLISYRILPGLNLSSSFGYNLVQSKETSFIPISAQDPRYNSTARADYGTSTLKTLIVEPQAEYTRSFLKGKMTLLAGGTWQINRTSQTGISAVGYTDDALIRSISAAPFVSVSSNSSKYHYTAFFSRFNYNWLDKYIITISGRRDGSSRFGPGRRFGNFGSVAAAWIFSNENNFDKRLPFISFGKIRGSYGTTGNDQIGDYQYLDLWESITNTNVYQGIPALRPTHLLNPDFRWELNRKLETSIDLGFVKDKILFSFTYYRNRSSNQLVSFGLPSQTGFNSLNAKNFPALVQNTGIEISLNVKQVSKPTTKWSSTMNVTIPRNKLISFPNLASSSYATSLQEGKSLNIQSAFQFAGVDPVTGIFKVNDINKDGNITSKDLIFFGDIAPKIYGGLGNTVSFKGFELYLFIEGRKQMGISYLKNIYSSSPTPGFITDDLLSNQPISVLQRWAIPGDITDIQKLTASTSSSAYRAITNFITSDKTIADASFVRIKTVTLSYQFPASLKKSSLNSFRIYLQGQNLFTFSKFKNSDPETQNVFSLPPLRTLTAGIQLSL
ncbi:MAG: TonB-dependent receptor plug, partial [Segetibacter sp.]|nr:TonB-dependent receptor plug [Segetibacter sp.]